MLTATANDGTVVRAHDEGRGRVILILHPGMDDGSSWHAVSAILAKRFRVVIPHRRPYRLDLDSSGSMAAELDHIRALVREIGEPTLLVGHSSGAVVALEALADMPAAFVGAVLYDPPIVTDVLPLGIESTDQHRGSIEKARTAVAAGKPASAFAIFAREVLKLPTPVVWLSALLIRVMPRARALVPSQIEDAAAIESLGNRLDQYSGIEIPTVLLTGERQQGDLHGRLTALAHAMPNTRWVSLPKNGHSAHRKAPGEVAQVIERLADDVS